MRFDRILLVSLHYPNSAYNEADVPNTGLGYIAEILEQYKIEYDVIDMALGYRFNDLKEKILHFKPDLIGVSMRTFRYKDTYNLIEKIKEKFPEIKIVVGGPHITVFQEKALEGCKAIDFGVVSEGEETIIELCRGDDLTEIKGLIYRENNSVFYNGDRERIKNLDTIPFPRYKKFELNKYWYPAMYIVSSRGCPAQCTFCAVKLVIGQRWRPRSPENIMEEIEYWYAKGYRRFEFIDDNFTLSKERVHKICDLIERSGMKITLNCPNGVRADRVDKELLLRMKEVGWDSITYGVEVGNNRMLEIIKKGESIETIENSIKDAVDVGLDIHLNFIIGFPEETIEDVEDGFKLALKYPIRHANFNNLVPYPGTELFAIAEQENYFVIPPVEYLNSVGTKMPRPLLKNSTIPLEKRKTILARARNVQLEIRKRYHIRRLKNEYGILGKIIGEFYSKGVIPKILFNNILRLKHFLAR